MLLGLYRLASHLGKTLSEISDMPLSEFYGWMAFLKAYPPDAGDDRRAASIMATVTNMAGRSLPDRKTVTAEDFLAREQKPQDWRAQKAFFKSLGSSVNG